ncbi:neuromedin-K receptor-like [Glandiceps talaboti]
MKRLSHQHKQQQRRRQQQQQQQQQQREYHVSASVSITTLAAIAVDRYTAIVDPLKKRSSKSPTALVIALVWIVSIGLGCVQLVKVRVRGIPIGNNTISLQCDEWWDSNQDAIIYESFIFTITYLAPLLILLYTYRRIAYILSNRQMPGRPEQPRQRTHVQSKIKVVRMLFIVVLAFGLCWMPLDTFNFVVTLYPEYLTYYYRDYVVPIFLTSHWLAMANSFLNPVLYSCLHEGFRNDFKHLCVACRAWRGRIRSRMSSRRGRRRSSTLTKNTSSTIVVSFSKNCSRSSQLSKQSEPTCAL